MGRDGVGFACMLARVPSAVACGVRRAALWGGFWCATDGRAELWEWVGWVWCQCGRYAIRRRARWRVSGCRHSATDIVGLIAFVCVCACVRVCLLGNAFVDRACFPEAGRYLLGPQAPPGPQGRQGRKVPLLEEHWSGLQDPPRGHRGQLRRCQVPLHRQREVRRG